MGLAHAAIARDEKDDGRCMKSHGAAMAKEAEGGALEPSQCNG